MRPPKTPASGLVRRPLPDGARLTALNGDEWLDKVLHMVPKSCADPWVWLDPHAGTAMVGWGESARFESDGEAPLTAAWRQFRDWAGHQSAEPLAFGSFPFSPAQCGFLVVPEVTVIRPAAGRPTEVIRPADKVASLPEFDGPDLDAGHDRMLPPDALTLTERPDPQARETWTRAVQATTGLLASREHMVEKVVLARSMDVAADRPLDRARIIAWLARHHRDCWVYSHIGLLGATPELLVEVTGGVFHCRILAGTRTPGWEGELLTDPKERHEHELSVNSVTGRLHDAGLRDAQLDGPFLLRLPNVTHLATDITARLDSDVGSARIADVLFPTAAICGTPRTAAFSQIQRVESIDRGRFSGPVGWIAPDGSGQWGLALRCAQLTDDSRRARVFAGAGILPSSQPDKEWHETQAKMAPMLEALRHG